MCGGHVYFDSRIDELRDVLGRVLPECRWCIELLELCSGHSSVAARRRFIFELRGVHGGYVFVVRLYIVLGLSGRELLDRIGYVLQ